MSALESVQIVVLSVYVLLLGGLGVFGLHRLLLTLSYRRLRQSPCAFPPLAQAPHVTVQLPIYNERYVAERVIRAVCALEHPPEFLHIQVLDDSTDDTSERVASVVAELAAQGINIRHLRREGRVGYKAGALAWGLNQAQSELIAIFDADFVPRSDFLKRLLPHFVDPAVGMVQARWSYLNFRSSLLSRLESVLLDGHFVIEHGARHLGGRFFNFNGTAGIWRRQAIKEAGGWQGDTLTEDLDLSYRAQLAGWRFVYDVHVDAPSELPVDAAAFKNQQYRWAKGSIQTALKLLPSIWRANLPLGTRLEATFHLLGNLAYPILLLLVALLPLVAWLRPTPSWHQTLTVDGPFFILTLLSVAIFYTTAMRALGARWWSCLALVPLTLGLGAALAVNNTVAIVEALLGRPSPFVRTPKFALTGSKKAWRHKRYRGSLGLTVVVELLLGMHLVVAALIAGARGHYGAMPLVILLAFGFLYLGGLSLAQRTAWPRRAVARVRSAAKALQTGRIQQVPPKPAPARPR